MLLVNIINRQPKGLYTSLFIILCMEINNKGEIKMIDKTKCEKEYRERKTISITIKVAPSVSTKLRQQKLSPTGIFMEALKELKIVE